MQYNTLIQNIQADIYSNGDELITGDILQAVLLQMVSAWAGAGAMYGGVITPASAAPADLNQATFYIAIQPGTYSAFGVTVTEPSIVSYGGGSTLTFTVSPLGLASAIIVNNLTTDDATKGLSAAQGVVLKEDVTVANNISLAITKLTGLKLRTGGITTESSAYELCYFSAKANKTYTILFTNSSGTIRFAYSTSIPANGVSVTNYKTSSYTEGNRSFTPTSDCYIIVANDTGFGTGDPIAKTPKTSGIGYDVYNLKSQVSSIESDITNLETELDSVAAMQDPFTIGSTQIADGSDVRYPAGSLVTAQSSKCSPLIPVENVSRFIYSLIAYTNNTAYAIAYYDADKAFISGLKSNSSTETEILSSAFPVGTAYIRVGSVYSENFTPHAKFYTNKDILTLANDLLSFKDNVDDGVLAPLEKYWAACGDSITHANHSAIPDLDADDIYAPIDDYQNKGYANATSGSHPNYVYYFCKKERMKWANYGYGGTILGNYIPKYVGSNNYLYPFIDTRITQFKAGVTWNYITIFFGWNDNTYGPIYQKDKWLTQTYGEDLGYPVLEEQVGTAGFANATQKAACDAIDESTFFDAFIGNINDSATDTWYGAWNYALGYLLKAYPSAKIMIVVPFIGGNDRTNSQKFRASTIAVAEKYGIPYFDINDLPYWYYTTVMNSTSFPNPDRVDGRWVKANGDTAPGTIEGFNRARFCADSVHPTLLGYQWLADPIGYTLLQK